MHKALLYPLRLLYPPKCVFCECILPFTKEFLLCEPCQEDYPTLTEPFCKKCGRHTHREDILCGDCSTREHICEEGIALYAYDGTVKEALYRFKYGGRFKYAQLFAQVMCTKLKTTDFIHKIDLIVPVPLSKERYKKRGYNQAEEVAKYISSYCGIPYNKDILIRTKHTKPQSSFTKEKRRQNLKNAFGVSYNLPPQYKVILLIDDIYTTGSTLDECAKTLKDSGAKEIYSAVICIGH